MLRPTVWEQRIATLTAQLAAAEAELARVRGLLRRCSTALRVGECDMQYHDKQGVRRSLQQQLDSFTSGDGDA